MATGGREGDKDAGDPEGAGSVEASGIDREDDVPVLRPEDRPERLIGQVLGGQYRMENHLGAGGFGDVFRAVQEKTGQIVAVKVLRPRYGKGAPSLGRQVARFRREMRACAELHHPHVVRLIDSGETQNGLLFSVFEYVPGMTLAELLYEKGALSVRTSIELMGQVLDALVCAHGKGVIHRDLKPNNIMISNTGSRPQTTVLDFGISAFLEGTGSDAYENLTISREILGTPSYAAPEQLRGEPPTVKSDLYAWGLVLLECLQGRRVYDGPSAVEVAYRQLSGEPIVLPVRLQKHWLGVLLRWTLEKEVARRAGDANALMERLLDKRPLGDLVDANGYLIDSEDEGPPRAARSPGESQRTFRTAGSMQGGESRQITAVCCTFNVSAAEQHQPPEVLDQSLRDAQVLCATVASRFGGHVVGNLGGQVLFYFGFPRASDTDARRSAIVALEIVHEIRRRTADGVDVPIEVRVGIHTGIVTVLGTDLRQASPIFGVTPAQAVQLALEAPANGILVSGASFRHLAASFELQPVETARRDAAYRLMSESRAESAAASSGASSRTPFVGRESEIAALEAAWYRSRDEQGAAILIRGEAGIGKSRLVRELRQRIQQAGAGWIEARCLPEMNHSALRPVVDLVAQTLNLSAPTIDESGRRLEAALGELGLDPMQGMPLLCPWFGLPLLPPYRPLPFSPQKQKTMALELLADLVVAMAARRSAAVLIEDLHWAAPTTLEYIDILIRKTARGRCLLLLTARPDLVVDWQDAVPTVELKSLDAIEVGRFVEGLMGSRRSSPELIADVVRRADGIPLFVEEIVRFFEDAVAQSGELGGASNRQVPGGLRDLLTGRLDRLGRAKETAQLAAAIGREFDYRLLARVVDGDEAVLLSDLDQMVTAELLIRRRHVDSPLYMFRHALIRDAAYESLLTGARELIHRRIGDALESGFPEVVESRPELLAHHFAAGNQKEKAIAYAKRATAAALAGSLFQEAVAHATPALEWVSAIADPQRSAEIELEIISMLTPALMATSGWGSDRVRENISRAEVLSQRVSPHASTQYAMLWLMLMYHNIRADWARFDEIQARAEAICAATGNRVLECVVHAIVGQKLLVQGRLVEAKRAFDDALALYDSDAHATHRQYFGQDVEVFSRGCLGMLQTLLGFPERAASEAHRALARAEELKSPYNVCMAKAYLAGTWHYQGDREKTRDVCAALYRDAEMFGMADWLPIANILGGWGAMVVDEADREVDRVLALGNRYAGPYWSFTIAQTEAALGRFDAALARTEKAIVQSGELAVLYFLPELLRLKGECLMELAARDPASAPARLAAAEEALERAIALARQQEARLSELRAATTLARLARSQPASQSRATAHLERLAELRAWFTEGHDRPELVAATELLEHRR